MKRVTTTTAGLVLGLVLAAGAASGATYLDRLYGSPEPIQAPRARALGGAGAALANGAFDLIDNPAMLATGKRSADLVTALKRASENRFVPLFDTFDSYVDETAIAVNDDVYSSWSGGVVLDQVGVERLVVAFGLFDRYDPRYDYFDERRSTATTDQIVSERYIRTDGILRSASFGAGYTLENGVALGAAFNWYFGTWSDRDALVPRAVGPTAVTSTLERDLSGYSFTLGAAYLDNERVHAGLAIETSPQLTDDYTTTLDGIVTSAPDASSDLDLPYRIQGGITYLPRNTLRTTFVADLVYMPWSEVKDPMLAGRELEDTWDVRFGVEHVYYDNLPGRIGFRYMTSYAAREADVAVFTFGLGYLADAFRVDVAGEIGKRNSRQTPFVPRDEQGPAVGAGLDRVEDTVIRVSFGAGLSF